MTFQSPHGAVFDTCSDCVEQLTAGGRDKADARRVCGRWVENHYEKSGTLVRINAADPTESKTRREAFRSALFTRWRDVRGRNREWWENRRAVRGSRIQAEYRRFFESLASSTVLESASPRQIRAGRHWTGSHITTAYDKGLELARRDLAGLDAPESLIEPAVRRTANEHRESLQQQYESVYYTIADHVTYATSKLTDVLREGVENDESASWLIDNTNEVIRSNVRSRYQTTASTAITRTINEAMLRAFEIAGVTEVGVAVESGVGAVDIRQNMVRTNAEGELVFTTAGDSRVCPTCRALAGRTVKISEVKNSPEFQPPVHPGCRCRLVATEMETNDETIAAPDDGPSLRSEGVNA